MKFQFQGQFSGSVADKKWTLPPVKSKMKGLPPQLVQTQKGQSPSPVDADLSPAVPANPTDPLQHTSEHQSAENFKCSISQSQH